MSNTIFISAINQSLQPFFDKYVGSRLLGLAETIVRKIADGDEYMPALVKNGEAEYVGLDDRFPITIYHKANSITISDKSGSGYGDSIGFKNYSYANVMIIAFDSTIIHLTQDQLLLLIEANLPESLKVSGYRQVNLKTESAVLNSLNVFDNEYKGIESGIPLNFRLMAVYYRIDSLFEKQCFPKC